MSPPPSAPESSSQALQRSQADSSRSQRSLDRQLILDEDEYTAALSNIIARDFFPSLVHLEASNDYLDAVNADDQKLINASVRRLSELQATPSVYATTTPYGGPVIDTPLRRPAKKKARYDDSLSLDEFQAKYTSEDNSSFTEILEEENLKRRESWSWAWEAQKRAMDAKTKQLQGRNTLMIEPAAVPGVRQRLQIEMPQPAGLLTDCSAVAQPEGSDQEDGASLEEEEEAEVKSLVLLGTGKYGDSEQSRMNVMAKGKDKREAGVDGWSFKTRNSLMFPPDADQSPHVVNGKEAPDTREIKHANTRLPIQEDNHNNSEPPTPTQSVVRAAIAGQPYQPTSPRMGGFSLVPNVPSPTPSQLGPTGLKQLMTMGQVISTPRILSSTEDLPPPSTPFHLPNLTQREKVAHKLSSSASRSLTEKAALMNGKTPRSKVMKPPSWTPRHMPGNLTPAARRLLDRTAGAGVAGSRRADAMGRLSGWTSGKDRDTDISRVSWTPTPK